ncbi:hypothetical protein GJ496_007309 [Pomphorhynchus laevis]|nr:hypothetical protein GJ496_007309 [Pomphorhynchus laevis]
MSLGKTRAAMRILANHDNISPVMSLDQEIGGQTVKDKLKEHHPRGNSLNDIAVFRHHLVGIHTHHHIRFFNISPDDAINAARHIQGVAGPSGINALGWRAMLESFG